MSYFMGIDGGGSHLRVAIIDDTATILVEITRDTANPNLIGRDVSVSHIQSAMREALQQVGEVDAVGIGIAGASAEHSEQWLRSLVREVLPSVHIAPASDNEIALVGAIGKHEGLLITSGTGSGVFGVNADGEKLQVGGWGYLLGDEGSGYWIGLQAVKYATECFDRDSSSAFYEAILTQSGASTGRKLIEAIYLSEKPVPTIATLTPIVLSFAEHDDIAQTILDRAVDALYQQATIAMQRLKMPHPTFAFAGSILENDTLVSRGLASKLDLSERPQALYRPVIGAGILAKVSLKETNKA